jgi:dephospho-CoA kinase
MLVIALTGGLGAGKSTAAGFFRDRGAIVLDLDCIAAGLLAPGSEITRRVVAEFGDEVLTEDGEALDRASLARIAFTDARSAARLNAIVHPAVAREVGPALSDIRLMEQQPDVVVLEVPLLAEAPVFAEMADVVLAIEAPVETRCARAVASGMTEPDARRRIGVQAADTERAKLADDVIVNDSGLEHFLGELERYWERHVAPGVE